MFGASYTVPGPKSSAYAVCRRAQSASAEVVSACVLGGASLLWRPIDMGPEGCSGGELGSWILPLQDGQGMRRPATATGTSRRWLHAGQCSLIALPFGNQRTSFAAMPVEAARGEAGARGTGDSSDGTDIMALHSGHDRVVPNISFGVPRSCRHAGHWNSLSAAGISMDAMQSTQRQVRPEARLSMAWILEQWGHLKRMSRMESIFPAQASNASESNQRFQFLIPLVRRSLTRATVYSPSASVSKGETPSVASGRFSGTVFWLRAVLRPC